MGTTGNLIFYLVLLIRFQQVEDEFLDSAWYLISEVHCQIHQKINCVNLSERLDLSQEKGEKWIVSLTREMKMDGCGCEGQFGGGSFFLLSFFILGSNPSHN